VSTLRAISATSAPGMTVMIVATTANATSWWSITRGCRA
jgi:hypothetical protein